jgi:NTE family protein
LRFAFQLSSITSNNLLKANYAFHNLAHHHEILPILPQFQHKIHLFDTDKIPYVIEEGEKATEKLLPRLRQLLAPAP